VLCSALQLKERQKEDGQFADEEKFVTSAYRRKLEEDKQWVAAQKLRWVAGEPPGWLGGLCGGHTRCGGGVVWWGVASCGGVWCGVAM
jgi:hypothetical protein